MESKEMLEESLQSLTAYYEAKGYNYKDAKISSYAFLFGAMGVNVSDKSAKIIHNAVSDWVSR